MPEGITAERTPNSSFVARHLSLLSVAWQTFSESVRDKLFYSLIVFALLMIAAILLFSNASLGLQRVMVANAGLAAIDVIGLILAVLIGVRLIPQEIEGRVVHKFISSSLRRSEFILGQYLGCLLTLILIMGIMAAGLLAAMRWAAPGYELAVAASLQAVYFIFLQLAIVAGLVLLFSMLTSAPLAAIITGVLYVAGNLSGAIRNAGHAAGSPVAGALASAIYYIIPNFANFQVLSSAVHGWRVPGFLLVSDSLYALLYVAIVISASVLIFEERQLD